MQKWCSDSDNVLAVMIHDEEANGTPNTVVSIAELPMPEKLEKFVEDVKWVNFIVQGKAIVYMFVIQLFLFMFRLIL